MITIPIGLQRLGAATLASAAAAMLLSPAFSNRTFAAAVCLVAALLAVAVASGVDTVMQHRMASRAPLPVAVAASVLGAVVTAAGLLGATSPFAVLDALASGWERFLSETPPVGAQAELLVVPGLHAWTVGTALALLARRDRPVGWSVAVLVAASGAALLLAAPQAPSLLVVLLVVAATLLLALLHAPSHAAQVTLWRQALPLLGASLLVAGLAATIPQPRERLSARDPDTVPAETVNGISPLAAVKASLITEPAPTQLRLSSAPADSLVRMATLERYDGLQWTVEGRFHRTSQNLAAPDGFASSDGAPTTTITVEETIGRWIPSLGTARSVHGAAFRWNPGSGDLLADAPLETSTTLHIGATPIRTATDPTKLIPTTDAQLLRLTRIDAASPQLLTQLDSLLGPPATPGAKLANLQGLLTQQFGYTTTSPAGHQDAMLAYVLADSKRGTPEQFAAIGALAARRAGFPARVVVGWKVAAVPTDASPEAAVPVTTADAYAWVEVATTDGWRSIDVTPPRSQTEPETPESSAAVGTAAAATAEPPPEQGDATILSPGTNGSTGQSWLTAATNAGIRFGLPALVIAVLATVALLKLQRRRLRASAPHPADRVLGAWDELIDRLIETGRPPDPAATPREVASTITGLVPEAGPSLNELAPLVDCAIHAPELVAAANADEAWAYGRNASTAIVRNHRDLRHPYRPIARPFDPRPLVRNRVHRP